MRQESAFGRARHWSLLAALALVTASCGDVFADVVVNDTDVCERDTDCPTETPKCNVSSDRCAECLSSDDCASTEVCSFPAFACVRACQSNTDCPASVPVCEQETGSCRLCANAGECSAATPHCDSTTGRCMECVENADCTADMDLDLCNDDGKCVGCITNGHCNEGSDVCSQFLGYCGVQCTGAMSPCPFDEPICDEVIGFCVECQVDQDCPSDEPICRNSECRERPTG